MSIINQINCGASTDNTGINSCTFDPKEFVGSLLVPTGTTISQAQINSAGGLSAYITSMLNEDDKSKRFQLIGNFEEVEDNSEDAVTETLGYGMERTIREGQYRMTFRFIKGGKCFHTAVRTYAGQEDAYDVLFIDSQMALIGTHVEVDSDIHIAGYTLSQIYVPKMTIADGSTMAGYRITYALADETQLNDRFAFVLPTGGDKSNMNRLKGIIDVRIVSESTLSGADLDVHVFGGCGATNMVDLFSTELSASAAWLAKGVGGADIPITTFTEEQGNKGAYLKLTLDTTDPAYPTTGGVFTLSLVAPSALQALGIEAPSGALLESNTVRVEVL